MTQAVTYGELRQFLLQLGYEDHSGQYLVFEHPEQASALLRMASHDSEETMLDRDVVKVRSLLDLSGLLDRDQFDQWIRTRTGSSAATG